MSTCSKVDIPGVAEEMLRHGETSRAEDLLRKFAATLRLGWVPVVETSSFASIAFWNDMEYRSFLDYQKRYRIERPVEWETPSYTKALYYLAFIAADRKDWLGALGYLDRALALEASHPLLLCQKAVILSRLRSYTTAYENYVKAIYMRPWAPDHYRSRAFRGAAIALMDLGRLNEAEGMLERAIMLEPESTICQNLLSYIEFMGGGDGLADICSLEPADAV
jgi:tetratricopeptide (TPR) repeat protein